MSNTSSIPPFKTCTKCGNSYPVTTEYFHRNKNTPSGLSGRCKSCAIENSRRYYKENKEAICAKERGKYHENPERKKASNKRYVDSHHPEYLTRLKQWGNRNREYKRQKDREYYQTNRDAKKENSKKWYYDNHDKAKEQRSNWYARNKNSSHRRSLEWAKAHPEYRKAATARRRARKRNSEGSYTRYDVLELFDLQCGRCAYCGIPLYDSFDVDHIIPLSRGGSNYPYNLALACAECNRSKNAKTPEEWKIVRGW